MFAWKRPILRAALLALSLMPLITVNAQDAAGSAVAVQFNGHAFDLPRQLADGFSAFVIDEASAYPDNADNTQPPRTEFRLLAYSEEAGSSLPVAWINIFNASDLANYPEYAAFEQLYDILRKRPDLSTEPVLPTLYPYQASALPPESYTAFFINAAYLDTETYNGITFIYGRVVQIGDSKPVLFYRVYFEGISTDQRRYVSAQVEGLQELVRSLEGVTNGDDYLTQTKALFQEPTQPDIIAWLDQARLMFSSFSYAD
ncbi:MAG: hypothetical protein LCI00_08815 [Chloroflexi bacterium]|nr:hypothetical protein [Chloroflexota bacterium]MCC6894606.1 hypothetical protein [Anaerolineae bacterium]